MSKFTVEEVNLICVFNVAGRTELIGDIKQVLQHLQGDEMGELAEQVLRKLEGMADEEFAGEVLEAAE
ncbi:transposon-transfer assisting family protein [Lachnospiraceae bacterium OttesenSCG-928-D06]|nr:transposon-transfer assisting family protein [Lachnospiraceae bacterium OttesenSCG-928-D06]